MRFVVTTVVKSDNKVVITRVDNNLSTNNFIIVNKGIIRTTTNFVYNKELDSASI
jgi:hypothetical protein